MKEITASGRTAEEAIQSALEQLNTTRDQVEITIIDEGKKGLLGVFGSKPAFVKVTIAQDLVKDTEAFLQEILAKMNVEAEIKTTVDGKYVTYDLAGENIAILIGKRGQTLNALQYLLHLVINKDSPIYYTVTLDAEGYRSRRKETLEALAKKMADKAIRLNKKVALDPMPAFERKVIHHVLQESHVSTYSDGIEPHRHIVIKPNKK
ncbi:RNA-binding cell elongation regulator Jag/EloR [Oceanobacillus senegalensis]|uniref:RNA-binding cell elongation regulator Jag/EloR n=1 Tax=Oceanobacillus senegalensis TaxID=1936063 RepID=UPI000A31424D|nr:RNA-binding cell elongation regulator Jag/EloR [Oceanobacillus senegalensis]